MKKGQSFQLMVCKNWVFRFKTLTSTYTCTLRERNPSISSKRNLRENTSIQSCLRVKWQSMEQVILFFLTKNPAKLCYPKDWPFQQCMEYVPWHRAHSGQHSDNFTVLGDGIISQCTIQSAGPKQSSESKPRKA